MTSIPFRLFLVLLCATAVACGGVGEEGGRPTAARPNVLLVSIDTLRADHLGMYGYERPTSPFLDGLAARGVRFDNAFAQTSWTLPSHMSLMTATHPQTHQVESDDTSLPADIPTLAEIFRQAGYSTVGFVSWTYLKSEFGFGRGFDRYEELLPPEDLRDSSTHHSIPADAFATHVGAWIKASPPERPAFLFLHLFDPHINYQPPLEMAQLFDPSLDDLTPGTYDSLRRYILGLNENAPRIPREELEKVRALYDGEIRFVDEALKRLFGELVEAGFLTDNSIVVLTSDHGEELDDHGSMEGHQWTLYDEVMRVPLVFLLPGGDHAGEVEGRVVQSIDIAPTLLEIAGLPIPESFEGRSLLPLIEEGEAAEWSEEAFFHIRRFDPKWAVRTATHKLIFSQTRQADDEGRPLRAGFELYDLVSDPEEQVNIFDPEDPLSRELARRLRAFSSQRVQRPPQGGPELSEEERERLRSLGYLD